MKKLLIVVAGLVAMSASLAHADTTTETHMYVLQTPPSSFGESTCFNQNGPVIDETQNGVGGVCFALNDLGATNVSLTIKDLISADVAARYTFLDASVSPNRLLGSGVFCDSASLAVPSTADTVTVTLTSDGNPCGKATMGTIGSIQATFTS